MDARRGQQDLRAAGADDPHGLAATARSRTRRSRWRRRLPAPLRSAPSSGKGRARQMFAISADGRLRTFASRDRGLTLLPDGSNPCAAHAASADPSAIAPRRRPGCGRIQLPHHLVPQLSQHAQRNHRPAVDLRIQAAQLVGRLAEPAKLLPERFGRQRMFGGLRQRLGRLQPASGPVAAVAATRKRLPTAASIARSNGTRRRGIAGVRLAKPARNCGSSVFQIFWPGRILARSIAP